MAEEKEDIYKNKIVNLNGKKVKWSNVINTDVKNQKGLLQLCYDILNQNPTFEAEKLVFRILLTHKDKLQDKWMIDPLLIEIGDSRKTKYNNEKIQQLLKQINKLNKEQDETHNKKRNVIRDKIREMIDSIPKYKGVEKLYARKFFGDRDYADDPKKGPTGLISSFLGGKDKKKRKTKKRKTKKKTKRKTKRKSKKSTKKKCKTGTIGYINKKGHKFDGKKVIYGYSKPKMDYVQVVGYTRTLLERMSGNGLKSKHPGILISKGSVKWTKQVKPNYNVNGWHSETVRTMNKLDKLKKKYSMAYIRKHPEEIEKKLRKMK